MKYILIFLVLFNFALFPKEKKSIYVYKILTKNTKDSNFESKFRNKMTGILLKDFSDYNLMDDDSIAGLKAKLEKSKMFGCNEEACMREISRSLNADEVITGTIEENNGKFKYSFKNSSRVKKGEENLSIKSLADGEFYFNQWEYFTGEIVRKLMNPSYAMNYKDAPLYENLDDFNYTTVKDLKEIKLPEIKGNTLDIVKRLKEVTIADADTAYQKKDYLLALNGFRDARDALASLSPEDKKKAGNMATDIQNRIYMAGDAMFAERLEELESYYKENSPMSLKAVKKSKGLDGWLYLFGDYQKTLEEGERNPVMEKRIAKRVVELAERRYRLLMEEEEKSGDEKMANGKYDSAISYYEEALGIVKNSQGILGDKEISNLARKLADAKTRRWNPEMEVVYEGVESRLDQLWKEERFDDYLKLLNNKIAELNQIRNKGGNREDFNLKIREKKYFYDTNISKAKEEYLARKWNPELVSLYDKSEKKLNQLWKEDNFEEYLDLVNTSINKMYELKNKGGNREDLYVKIWEKKYFYDRYINSAKANYLARKKDPDMEVMYSKIEKKSEELWKDGEYADYIDYIKDSIADLSNFKYSGGTRLDLISLLEKKIIDFPDRLKKEEKLIEDRISIYMDASKIDESYYEKIQNEQEKEIYRRKEAQVASLPESFTTKSGLIFTKILKKDGNPVYVSDRIRPNQVDSWYFTRDYAEKLNKEDNCPDCYRLPYFDEILNLKAKPGKWPDGSPRNYEGLWLKSWSPAPSGMIMGNIAFGIYTFNFIHDVVFHPITWQSYLYPISPDSVYASRGGSWDSGGRTFRSAYRSGSGWDLSDGFRLVRPLR